MTSLVLAPVVVYIIGINTTGNTTQRVGTRGAARHTHGSASSSRDEVLVAAEVRVELDGWVVPLRTRACGVGVFIAVVI